MGRVRSKANALSRLLDTISRPVYVVDRHRRLIYCNAACGDLLGVDPAELIGQLCEYRAPAETSSTQLVHCFCPPPETFAGTRLEQPVTLIHQTGRAIEKYGLFIPLGADRTTCAGVLVVLLSEQAAHTLSSEEIELDAPQLHQRLVQFRKDMLVDNNEPLDELIGRSRAMRRIRAQIQLASQGAANILVLGPTGSGREHIAQTIHRLTVPEEAGPVAPILCPVMDAELLQTAIRTFARQTSDLPTRIPPALLLLDVDQLRPDAQAELMGFLDLPGFHLLAIATATESLLSLARQDRYRSDLAELLSTLVIDVPPLRQRREDIPLLAQHFVEKFNARGGPQHTGFDPAALDELTNYDCPGNVDELAEVVADSCQRATDAVIETEALADRLRWAADADAHPVRPLEPISLDQVLLDVEKEMLQRALRLSKGNKTKAANLLGIPRARLHRRLQHFGL